MMKQFRRKLLSMLLTVSMLCSLCAPAVTAAQTDGHSDEVYSDIHGHWGEDAIVRWTKEGIVSGYDGQFMPDATLTRGQMATILSGLLNLTKSGENPFADVADDAWYTPYVLRCYEAGLMSGDGKNAYPEKSLSRQEAMVMLCQALAIKPDKNADLSAFEDGDQVADWAKPYVAALVDSGLVSGVGDNLLAPGVNMSRAANMVVLNSAVKQYITKPGTYDMPRNEGIVMVTTGDVTLKGKTDASVVVTPGADGEKVTFFGAKVNGEITVQANDALIVSENSVLPEITMTGEGSRLKESAPAGGGGGGGGSSGGGSVSYENLEITQPGADIATGVYQNVVITDAVGDGEVTLRNVTIHGDLIIRGGGSGTVELENCSVRGKVVLDKQSGQQPRLFLSNTPVGQVNVEKPAIVESGDSRSAITSIQAKDSVEVKGGHTAVGAIVVPANAAEQVTVTVTDSTVNKVESKKDTTIESTGTVGSVKAEADVTVTAGTVGEIEIPATNRESVCITVGAAASVNEVKAAAETVVDAQGSVPTVSAAADVTIAAGTVEKVEVTAQAAVTIDSGAKIEDLAVNTQAGAAITNNGIVGGVSTELDSAPEVTVDGDNADQVPAHFHVWNSGVVTAAATCTATGVKTYTCTADGCTDPAATKEETIPATGHTRVSDAAVAATCTATGLTEGAHCSVCDTVVVAQTVIPALGHTEKVLPAVAATCTATGLTEGKQCTVCQAIVVAQTVVPALGHTEKVLPAVAATCTTTGLTEGKQCTVCQTIVVAQTVVPVLGHDHSVKMYDESTHWSKCSRCDDITGVAVHTYTTTNCAEAADCTGCDYVKPAGEHAWGTYQVTTAATCTEPGVKTATCGNCGAKKTETIAALGHTEKVLPAVAATCTATGLTEGKQCTVCQEILVAQTEISALGHTEKILSAVDPTCATTGLTEGKQCTVCQEVLVAQTVIPVLGHDFTEQKNNENTHWYECSRCDAIDGEESHKYNTTDCTEQATCSVCFYEKPAGQHNWVYEKDGDNNWKVCSGCGERFAAPEVYEVDIMDSYVQLAGSWIEMGVSMNANGIAPDEYRMVYTSTDETVATVKDGVLTLIGEGKAIITLTVTTYVGETPVTSVSDTCAVTVLPADFRDVVMDAEDRDILDYIYLEELGDVSRLELAQLIAGCMGLDVVSGADPGFSDCDELTAEEKAVIAAVVDADILTGNDNGEFHPYAMVARAEVAVVLDNMLGRVRTTGDKEFDDVTEDNWFHNSVTNLYNLGIITVDGTTFEPTVAATKADILQWMINAHDYYDEIQQIMADNAMAVSNIHFDSRAWLVWDAPANAQDLILKYDILMTDDNGNSWVKMDSNNKQGSIVPHWRKFGEFNGIRIVTKMGDNRVGEFTDYDFSMTISTDEMNTAFVQRVQLADGSYVLEVSGLEPNEKYRVMLGEDEGDLHGRDAYNDIPTIQADGKGNLTAVPVNDEYAEMLANGCYFAVDHIGGYSVGADGKSLKYFVDTYAFGTVGLGNDPVDPTEGNLIQEADSLGLLRYVEQEDLDDLVRVTVAKLMAALGDYTLIDGSNLEFTDCADLTAKEKDIIATLIDAGVVAGYSDSTFKPDDKVTYSAVALMIYRVMGSPNGDISGSNWQLYTVKEMTDLGIMRDSDNVSVSSEAEKKIVLTWMIRAFDWMENNQGGGGGGTNTPVSNPDFEIRNARFELEDGVAPYITFDYPTATATVTDPLLYTLYAVDQNGEMDAWESTDDVLHLIWLEPDVDYDLWIVTSDKQSGEAFGWVELDLDLEITAGDPSTAEVTFVEATENGSKAYSYEVSDGTAGNPAMLFVWESGRGSVRRSGYLDIEGCMAGIFAGDHAVSHVENGKCFVREFENMDISTDGKSCSFVARDTVKRDCEIESNCSHTATNDHPVSNIRLDGSWIVWDEPAVKNSDYGYKVKLSRNGGSTWDESYFCGGNETKCHIMRLEVGHYDTVEIKTFLPENCCDHEVGSVTTSIDLTVIEKAAATNATVIFEPVAGKNDTYSIVINGLTPGNWGDIALGMDADGKDSWGSYGTSNADGSGRAVRDEITAYWPDQHTLEELLTQGYYDLYEFNMQVSADGKTGTMTRITHGGWTKSVIGTRVYSNSVWFEDEGNGYLYLCWDYEPLSDINEYDGYEIAYYNQDTRMWHTWAWEGIGWNQTLAACCGSEPGHYTKVRVVAVDEEQNANGNWEFVKDKLWFEADIDLTVTRESDAPAATVVDHSNGEYTFAITNLWGSRYELVNSEEADGMGGWWTTSGSLKGEQTVDVTVNWPFVKTGYYRLREYVHPSAQDTTASYGIRETDWIRCFNCGHAAIGDYPVSNIRLDDVWIVWDEPEVQNPDYYYSVRLSQDGGKTWFEDFFYEDSRIECHIMRLKEGHYDTVEIKTFLPEDCCDREVGSVTASIDLTVDEWAAANNATVIFVPVAGKNDTYSIVINGFTPDNWGDIALAMDATGKDSWGSYGTSSADGSGCAVRDEITAYWPDQHTMEELLTQGYYDLYEFNMQVSADGKTGTMTRITHGGWTKSVIGTYQPVSNPDYEITNARFVLENGAVPYITFDYPVAAATTQDELRYILYSVTQDDEMVAWDAMENELPLIRLDAGVDDDLWVATESRNTGKALGWVKLDLDLEITAGAPSNAEATFREGTENGNKAYFFEVTDGTPGNGAMLFVWEDGYGNVRACRHLDTDGSMAGVMTGDHALSHVENGKYMIREFESLTVSADGKSCSFVARDTVERDCEIDGGNNTAVAAAKGIASMQQTGMSIKIGMIEPDSMDNISYFTLALYDSSDKEGSMMTGITCSKDHPYFYVSKDKFDPDYKYDKVEITSIADNGAANAVWTDDISVTQNHYEPGITYNYDLNNVPEPLLTVRFEQVATAFYHIGIYENGKLIENENAYSASSDNGLTVSRSCIAAEQAAIAAGTASVKVNGWDVTVLEKTTDHWSIAFSAYTDEIDIEAPELGSEPIFGTPVLKTDGNFMWLELTVQNMTDPTNLELWVQQVLLSNGAVNGNYMTQSRISNQWEFEGNVLKIYRVGYIMATNSNIGIHVAVKDPATGVMSEYSTNALVKGETTREDVAITAVKATPATEDDYYTITCSKNNGSNFTAGHYYVKWPATMDYTGMVYVPEDTATIFAKNTDSEILAAVSATVQKVKPVANDEGDVVINLTSYNTHTFDDVILAGISSEEGDGVVSAARGVPVALTMTIPEGVTLTDNTPTVTARMYDTVISDVAVNGNVITFNATFNNLYITQDTVFYLDAEDTDIGYPLCTEMLKVNYVEMVGLSAQANVDHLYVYFYEGVTFYKKDGTAITATDTASVHAQVAENLILYKNGEDMGITFVPGYQNGSTYYFFYKDNVAVNDPTAEYSFGLKDGIYFRSTSNPNKGFIGKPEVQYNGPNLRGCSMNMTDGILYFELEAYDRTGENVPALNLGKAGFSVAPAGYWNRPQYQIYLGNGYAKVEGTAPAEKGTYTMEKRVYQNQSSGDYTYNKVVWCVNVKLTDADIAALQAKIDSYNGTDSFTFFKLEGFSTAGSSVEQGVNPGISKMLTIVNETPGHLNAKVKNFYNSTNSAGTYSGATMQVLASVFATTVELTYNGITVTVDYPESGTLTVTEAMFSA